MKRTFLIRFAWLSVVAAIATIGLKAGAYALTGSVALLSDALESLVNLAGAIMAVTMLSIAAHPPDEDHAYGHGKAEYFSSGAEGMLIGVAALGIGVTAIERLITPRPLEQIGLGLGISVFASLLNWGVALVLRNAGRKYNSIALEANAKHLFTDVWTSAGVLVGVSAVAITGWGWLDSLAALVVAIIIVWSGFQLVRRSVSGLMDTALSVEEQNQLQSVLARYSQQGIQYHALRTRKAGARSFVSVHVLAPGVWTVHRGHQLLEQIERDIRNVIANAVVFTHLESLDDQASWHDMTLDREDKPEITLFRGNV